MDIQARLSVSFYKTIAAINDEHKIYVAQHMQTGKVYVKKILDVYNKAIYEYLRCNPIPHTPRIYEVCEVDDQLVVIEEYISGDTLEQLLESGFSFTDDKICEIIAQLCLIVKDLHSCNPPIIHRDIKPSNIMLSPSGEVFLLDFNASKYMSAKKDEDTSLLGTKGYAAPEQYGFGASTTQTDIYAIGMLLKDLTASSPLNLSDSHTKFQTIITKCTKLNPEDRYKDVTAILRLLGTDLPAEKTVKKSLPAWASYLPPGFRSLSILNIFLSLGMYSFVFWLCLSLEVKDATPSMLTVERFFCLIMFLAIIFCTGNYRNIQSHFPPCRVKNTFLHVLAVVLLDFLVALGTMTIMAFVVFIIS